MNRNNNYIVYAHIAPNEKLYIGITSQTFKGRCGENGCKYGKTVFGRAINKYGWNNFKHIVLLENLSKEVAIECEIYLIAKYKTTDSRFGYNIQSGGQLGNKDVIVSEETRRKISEVKRSKHLHWTDEQKLAMSEKLKGREFTAEHKANLSKALKGKYTGELNANYGKKFSKEHREKMSKSQMGHKLYTDIDVIIKSCHTSEANLKRKQTNIERQTYVGKNNPFYGKHHSEETKNKLRKRLSESNKNRSWVTNDELHENHFVLKSEVDEYLAKGYRRGFTKWKFKE